MDILKFNEPVSRKVNEIIEWINFEEDKKKKVLEALNNNCEPECPFCEAPVETPNLEA